eukprot:403364037
MLSLITFSIITLKIKGQNLGNGIIQCPVLKCDKASMLSGQCSSVKYNLYIQQIIGYQCYDSDNMPTDSLPDVCPLDLQDGTYAWMDEYLQQQSASNNAQYGSTSIVRTKKTTAYCANVGSFMQDLRPGRKCKSDNQCKSKNCNEGQCRGLEQNSFCHIHDDCQAGLYCRNSINWPFESKCSAQKGQYENCANDYECQNALFCWYASNVDRKLNQTKCLPLYSQVEGVLFGWSRVNQDQTDTLNLVFADFEQNGKFCQSGLAHPVDDTTARCGVIVKATGLMNVTNSDTKFTTQVEMTLNDSYACSPVNQTVPCKLRVDNSSLTAAQLTYASKGKRSFVEVPCKCDLSSSIVNVTGYCGSVIGTSIYTNAVAAKLNVLQKSKCHTLDRADMRAQKDPCGIGTNNEEWRFAVEKVFNVTHWPYIQVPETQNCVYKVFGDSWYNLNLDQAIFLSSGIISSILVTLGLLLYSILE